MEQNARAARLRKPGGAYITTQGRKKNVTGLLASMGTQRTRFVLPSSFKTSTTATRGGMRRATRGEATRARRAERVAHARNLRATGLKSFAKQTLSERSRVGLHTRARGITGGPVSPYRTKSQRQRAVHVLTRGRSKVSRQSISRHANLGSLFNRLHPRAKNGRFIRK